jgi:putative DNA methylase
MLFVYKYMLKHGGYKLTYRKKLIEVALPLDDINVASAREKSIRHGHPSTLHLWWARRPLAAARAVIFAQMVDDPLTYVDVLKLNKSMLRKAENQLKKKLIAWQEVKKHYNYSLEAGSNAPEPGPEPKLEEILAELERERLFEIIRELVKWENTTNEKVLQSARDEIWKSWRRACAENADHPRAEELFNRDKLPAFHDPFAGGGSLPLEAQRLGLEAYASDLNPVAVLINKAMIEIPPKFAGMPPVNPEARQNKTLFEREWKGAEGLAEDVRYYGKWMRDEAEKRIGHLYPKVKITEEMITDPDNPRPDLKQYVGRELTVIAWIWTRTVKSPNPAFAHVDVPLASTFLLSTKKGKEAYIEPVVEGDSYRFRVKVGVPADTVKAKRGTKLSRGANFECVISCAPIAGDYIKSEGRAGRMGERLMAIVAEGDRGRVYLSPVDEHEEIARSAVPEWRPEGGLTGKCRDQLPLYGMETFADIFTNRHIMALVTFSNIIVEAREIVKKHIIETINVDKFLSIKLKHYSEYDDMLAVYLSFGVDYAANYWSKLATPAEGFIRGTFSRQALQMAWDYAEAPPFGSTSGNWLSGIDWIARALYNMPINGIGNVTQADVTTQNISFNKIISTDPPYYDNICYADLSDFFYIWLRNSLKALLPDLFSTLAVPKAQELIASPYRFKNRQDAEAFFLNGMFEAIRHLTSQSHPAMPITIYYAFKQAESDENNGIKSTGWETFLDAILRAGLTISGTWPMRTERSARTIGIDANALASSIVLVCRKRPIDAETITRRAFITALKEKLPTALAYLQRSNIAPVDLAQAAIGPGMGIYTRYSKVIDAEGKELTVREALTLINQTLDEVLAKQEGDFDSDTRWALAWFEQYGFSEGEYGVAETLSNAKNTSVSGLVDAGILYSKAGKVRLLKTDELNPDWDPATDKRLTVWEMVHQLIRNLDSGEESASELLVKLGGRGDSARELAYRLYSVCERKKWTQEALAYNGLIQSWSEIESLARKKDQDEGHQQSMFGEE